MRRVLALAFLALAITGLILHFTLRDSVDGLSALFYAVPLPVAGGLFLGAALFTWRRLRIYSALLGIASLGFWFVTDYGFASPKKGGWKFITWNMHDATHPSPGLFKIVRTEWPDFMALLEAGRLTPEVIAAYERALPGYHMLSLGDDRGCLMRGTIASVSETPLTGRTRVVTVRVLLRDTWMRILVVDLDSGIFLSRRPALEWIAATAGQSAHTVVLGDFNTPLESALLADLRHNFTETTEGPHAGFRETWPYGAPFLSLDQIWISQDFRPVFAKRIFTLDSDHSPVVAVFGLK